MRPLRLGPGGPSPLRILCLGAHADDIEIGCAGTLMEMSAGGRDIEVRWSVFSAPGDREAEARLSAARLLPDAVSPEVAVHAFRDGYFPDQWAGLKDAFERLAAESEPDLILTHRGEDAHQDHRVVSTLTWQTFRDHLILEYEVPKYDGDLGRPNLFVPLSEETARRKARHLVASFPSQAQKPWFTEDTFLGLSRLRGVECASTGGHAEAFHGRKLSVAP